VSQSADSPRARGAAQAELVERARAGDHAAFSVLANDALPRVFGTARLILRDQDRAEDAVQDAFLSAWRHIAALRDPAAWDAWLYRLTVRACYRHARNAAAERVVELDIRADRAESHDFTRAIAEHVRMQVDQRAVIVLHFYLDLPLSQAAAVLGIPIGTVKSRLHRALEALRVSLGQDPTEVAGAMREWPA
jgi:RNA polymerase sigma-70 factor (ECF subfamily)